MNEDVHFYEVNLRWNSERKGILGLPVLPTETEVTTPPDFPKGMKYLWTLEHLFVTAVNRCLMATFLAIDENSRFAFFSFECNAVGIVGKIDGKLAVTEIALKPKVLIPTTQLEEQLKKILEMSKRECLITNSIITTISLEPSIVVQ